MADGWSEEDVFIDLHGIGAGERWRDELINAYLLPAKTPHAADSLARMMASAGIGPREGLANTISMPSLLVFGDQDTNKLPQDEVRPKKLKHKLQP